MRNKIQAGVPKVGTSLRLAPLVKGLIAVERAGAESDGDYIERLVLTNVKTEEGRRMIVLQIKNRARNPRIYWLAIAPCIFLLLT